MANKNKNQKAQAFSTDILVVIVLILFGSLALVLNKINEEQNEDISQKAEEASKESEILVNELRDSQVINQENKINKEELISINKDELKQQLELNNDFAIVFERNGELVKIDSNNNITCIGSSSIKVNGIECR